MANKVQMKFKKGDDVTHTFKLPVAEYTAGGTLYFTAKPVVDNDATDAAAVIDKSFGDADSTDSSYATWSCAFEPGDITGVNFSNGEKKKSYLGEFQWIESDGTVHTYPADDNFIEVIIYADIRRATS
ncbi:hypothetical protein KDA23_07895 [Candidatus Saccharibacteria bacterium]|nr:hypothetical protein [Candidatus Saccharibacteria bacterium]